MSYMIGNWNGDLLLLGSVTMLLYLVVSTLCLKKCPTLSFV